MDDTGFSAPPCHKFDLGQYERVFVIGGGKAGAPMAQALSAILDERLVAGWVNVKQGHLVDVPLPAAMTVHEASHPIPDEAGRSGAQHILDLVHGAGKRDLIFCLISGGGSALLPLPTQGITLGDLQALTDELLRCGATINEINAVRKHCSQIKGGQLARAVYPATVISLILSDVVGNPLDVIASGPTVPDTSTFADAYGVLRKYNIVDTVPERIVAHLRAGLDGDVPETPKPGDPVFENVYNFIIGSNAIAARAARTAAAAMGFNTLVLSTYIEGEAREVGRVMAGIAKSLTVEGWPLSKPACVIAGGETTVTVRGSGKGGRNQELALAVSLALEGWQGITVVTLATDGTDGPTDAAGAIVDGETVRLGRERKLLAADFLARNDSYTFFDHLGDLIRTGPTNTNVNDLIFILKQKLRIETRGVWCVLGILDMLHAFRVYLFEREAFCILQ
jgi:hydroxypyruvate reductase